MAISASVVRYIKLGRGGRWENAALERGELLDEYVALIDEADRFDRFFSYAIHRRANWSLQPAGAMFTFGQVKNLQPPS